MALVPGRCEQPTARLSGSRGQPFHLARVDVEAQVEGPIARTAMTIAIAPPERGGFGDDEAVLSLVLPRGAILRDLELEVAGAWQHGGVVPRRRARETYDAIVDRRIDPAIAEQDEPGRVDVRVFPIPEDGHARVRLTWLQPLLEDRAPLEVPLCGLPTIETLELAVDERIGTERRRHTERRRDAHVVEPMTIALDGGRPAVIRQGRFIAARVEAQPALGPTPVDGLTILVDTSASRAQAFDVDLRALETIMSALARRAPSMPIQLAAFDDRLVPVYDGDATGARAALTRLRGRGALGGTDLVGVIGEATGMAPLRRMLLVGDGIATLGALEVAAGQPLRDRLRDAGVERLDVLVPPVGGRTPMLVEWLARNGEQPGRVIDPRRGPAELLTAMDHATAVATVELPGGRITSPSRWFDGEIDTLLLAELDASATWAPRLRDATITGAVVDAELPELIAPLVADAEVRGLDAARGWLALGDARRGDLEHRATRIAVHHRLLSPHTAVLALESRADFVRWGLDAYAPADEQVRHIEEFKRLEPEAAALERAWKRDQVYEEAYLRAREAWLQAAAQGRDPGPEPTRAPFYAARDAALAAEFHTGLHATAKPGHGLLDRIDRALDRGQIDDARLAVAAAWASRREPIVALAGGRVEQAAGDAVAAARWLTTVPELLAPGHALHDGGVYFLDPRIGDRRGFEQLVALQDAYARERPWVLRGIAALARRDAVAAIRRLDTALRAHAAWARAAGERDPAPPESYLTLMAMAAAMASADERRDVRAILRHHRVAPLRTASTIVLVAATEIADGRIGLVVEAGDHRRLFPGLGVAPSDRGDALEGMIAFTHADRLPRPTQALVWYRDDGGDEAPVVGALYTVTADGRGGVTVGHRPFAMDDDRTIDVPL